MLAVSFFCWLAAISGWLMSTPSTLPDLLGQDAAAIAVAAGDIQHMVAVAELAAGEFIAFEQRIGDRAGRAASTCMRSSAKISRAASRTFSRKSRSYCGSFS